MFARYLLIARKADDFLFSKYFVSINQAIKVASGFDVNVSLQMSDNLLETIFNDKYIRILVKELNNND